MSKPSKRNPKEEFLSRSEKETIKFGKIFGEKLARKSKVQPHLFLLEGPEGAGKTSWVKGFITGYLKKENIVTSPSYSLINCYSAGKKEVVHADFYRLRSEDDLESVGFWELISNGRVVIIEWGTLIKFESLPANLDTDIIEFKICGVTSRLLKLKSTRTFNR